MALFMMILDMIFITRKQSSFVNHPDIEFSRP